jgi:predicted kinase
LKLLGYIYDRLFLFAITMLIVRKVLSSMKMVFFVRRSGVGKTTISELTAKRLNVAYLDKDIIGKQYMNKISDMRGTNQGDRDSKIYRTEFRDMEYKTIFDIATQNLLLGQDVMLVAPFTKEIHNPDWIENYLTEIGLSFKEVEVKVVVVFVPSDINKDRIHARNAERDRWKVANWEAYVQNINTDVNVKWNLPKQNVLRFDNSTELTEKRISELLLFINN